MSEHDREIEITLDDGCVAHCSQVLSQGYSNMTISAGLVAGIEPDTVYLRLERDGQQATTLFLRPDEMLAVIWVASGTLWSAEMLSMDEEDVDLGGAANEQSGVVVEE